MTLRNCLNHAQTCFGSFVELFVELDKFSTIFCHQMIKRTSKDLTRKSLEVAPAKDLHAFCTEIQV